MSQRSSQRSQRTRTSSSQQPSSQSSQRERRSQRDRDEDETPSQREAPDVNVHELKRMTSEVVQYFLIMEQKRYPVKKADITKLLGLKGNSNRTFKAVIEKVGDLLENVFGFRLHQFEDRTGFFVLLNQVVMPPGLSHQKFTEDKTILFLTLSSIFLSGGQALEDDVWSMLNILGYRLDVCKKLVTQELVKQLYIEAAPVPQSDPPKLNFLWGDRAKIEFTKLEILTFASRIYGIPPEQFGTLWTAAQEDAQERE